MAPVITGLGTPKSMFFLSFLGALLNMCFNINFMDALGTHLPR